MEFEEVRRFEYKYHISYFDYIVLKKRLNNVLSRDLFAGSQGNYLVKSIYFDNDNNNAYHDKIEGYRKRQKLRIRMYNNNSDVLKLEMKEKIDDIIKKTSVVIDRDQANALMKGERVSNKHIPDNIAYTLNSHFFKPVVIVEYTREAFCMNLNRIRITFDSDLKKQEHDLDFFSHDLNLHKTEEVKDIILEVKFNNFLPKYISNLLTFNNTDRLAISKYCFSRDIIY